MMMMKFMEGYTGKLYPSLLLHICVQIVHAPSEVEVKNDMTFKNETFFDKACDSLSQPCYLVFKITNTRLLVIKC